MLPNARSLAQPDQLIQCACLSIEQRRSHAQTFHVTERVKKYNVTDECPPLIKKYKVNSLELATHRLKSQL